MDLTSASPALPFFIMGAALVLAIIDRMMTGSGSSRGSDRMG